METAAHVPFYAAPDFWVLVSFVIFIVLVARKATNFVVNALDERAEKIRTMLEESTRLRDEAQELLASYQRKQREAADEAQSIVRHAEEEAERIRVRSAVELEAALKRREEMASERIQQAEAKAVSEVQAAAVDVAIEAARRVLKETVQGERADALIAAAIKDMPARFH
jgi:F-type H+-transporting ATPase subunit b